MFTYNCEIYQHGYFYEYALKAICKRTEYCDTSDVRRRIVCTTNYLQHPILRIITAATSLSIKLTTLRAKYKM